MSQPLLYLGLSLFAKLSFDPRSHDIERYRISAAVDDNIRILLRGLNVNAVHDLDRAYVLIDNTVNISASLGYVASESTQDPLISIGIGIDLIEYPTFRRSAYGHRSQRSL